MKRLFSLLLAICFIPALSVTAADNYRVSVSAPAEVFWGEEIDLTFTLSNIPEEGLCGIDVELGFNPDMVEFTGISFAGMPTEGDWCSAGRAVGATCFIYVFDNYNETTSTPASIRRGSTPTVTVTFKSKVGAEGNALFTVGSYGSVTGAVFTEDGPVSVYGLGAQNKTVLIKPLVASDKAGDGWFTKNGVMYVTPGLTAGDLAEDGILIDSNGKAKENGAAAVKGDSFVFGDNTGAPVYIAMDVNCDGYFTTTDYMLLRNYLSDGVTLSAAGLVAADANGDGLVSTSDLGAMKTALNSGVFPY